MSDVVQITERLKSTAQTGSLAPGKIILSGEHSIVYGSPALAVAVDIYAQAFCNKTTDRIISIEIKNPGLNNGHPMLFQRKVDELPLLVHQLDRAYHRFTQGKINICNILEKPTDLYFYAIGLLLIEQSIPDQGLHITLNLQMPLSSGMGSSSASLAALLYACACFYDHTLSRNKLKENVAFAERLQHGCISQIDPVVSVYGGMVRVETCTVNHTQIPDDSLWYLVNTGIPEVSTGQCVEAVRQRFAKSSIWDEFSTIVRGFEQALLCGDSRALRNYVRRNHQLLVDIGVVPTTVQKFIYALKKHCNAVGKITGAGAISGEKAGFVLVRSELPIHTLCNQFKFSFRQLQPDAQGARLVKI